MDAGLSRASLNVANPHQWHTYEQYRVVHDRRLDEHSFIDRQKPHTLVFDEVESGGALLIHLEGDVYFYNAVTLKTEKWFETRFVHGMLQVRGLLYRYIGYTRSGNLVLKYHNLHDDATEYVHRIYDSSGEEVFSETLTRAQFPTMTEVMDELSTLTRGLSDNA